MTTFSSLRSIPALLLLTFVSSTALLESAAASTTWSVRKDGTGDFTTINAAKNTATSGDIIEVGPGVYAEEIDFSYAVTLRSTDGAASTILDGEEIRRLLIFRYESGSTVDGFTVRDGIHISAGGGLRVQQGATATVSNCVFEGNYSEFDGGAVVCRDAGSHLDMFDCSFLNNSAFRHAGGALIVENGAASFTRCIFDGNSGAVSGALASASNAVYSVNDCLFAHNSGGVSGIYAFDSSPTVEGNTFSDNMATGVTINIYSSQVVFRRNILANDLGAGYADNSNVSENRTCNIYWNNSEPVLFGGLNPGEVEANPLFCDAPNGDFTISAQSPAAPAHSSCGQLVGAYPVECDIIGPPPVSHSPSILSILDVPNDQGHQVRLRWEKSDYDAIGQPYVITGYAVYRYQGNFLASTKLPSSASRASEDKPSIDGWDYLATVPARGDDIYQYVAPTLCDKPKHGDPCWTFFFVSAMTPDPLRYYDSSPDSGYSIDNLPPGPPGALTVAYSASGVSLEWEASAASDVAAYNIYRAFGQNPIPGTEDLVHMTDELSWIDTNGTTDAHYLVSAVDANGNEGDPSSPGTATGTGRVTPERYALRQNSPNPFNPLTHVGFDVPAPGGRIRIDIFDVAGHRVRSLLDEYRTTGTWSVDWDGRTDAGTRASSGVYFYRLRAPGFVHTRRMTLLQ